jgi:phage-related protein
MSKDAVIGRVSVKVWPDTTDFKRDTKKSLERIEKSLYVKLPTKIDMSGAKRDLLLGIRELNALARAHKVRVRTEADTSAMQQTASELEQWRKRISPVKVGVTVDTDPLRKLLGFLANLGASAAKFAAVASAIGGIAALSLSAASNLAAMSASIASIGPALLALPGLLTGVALGLGATVLALKDFNEVFPDVKGKLGELQDAISENFWTRAKAPIREMIDTLLPQLSAGMAGIATNLGNLFGDLASSLRRAFDGALTPMFDKLGESIEIARGATDGLARIIATLGQTGADYLPRLAQWFVDITNAFDGWLSSVAADGRLKGWIDGALLALSDLGRVLGGAVRIVAGIGRAAAEAGGSGLTILADALGRIADVVNGETFQTTLTAVFRAAHDAIERIGTIAGPSLTRFFEALGAVLTEVLPLVGDSLGTALAAIADSLAQIEVREAIVAIFEGVRDAFKEIAPVLPDLVKGIADLVKEIAPLLPQAGELISYLVPIIVLFGKIVKKAIPPLLTAIEQTVDDIGSIVDAFRRFGNFITDDVLPIWDEMKENWNANWDDIRRIFNEAKTWITDKWTAFKDFFSVDWSKTWDDVKSFFSTTWTGIKDFLSTKLGEIKSALGRWFGDLVATTGEKLGTIKGKFSDAWAAVKQKISELWEGAKRAFSDGVGDVTSKMGELPGKIARAIPNPGGILLDIGKQIVGGLVSGIEASFQKVKDTLGRLTKMLPDWKGPANKDKVLLKGAGQLIIEGLVSGLESRYGDVQRSLAGLTRTVAGTTIPAPELAAPQAGMSGAVARALVGAETVGPTVNVNKSFTYNAAPGSSISSEEDLFAAASRSRMVGW